MLCLDFPPGKVFDFIGQVWAVSFRAVHDDPSNPFNIDWFYNTLITGDRETFSPARLEGIGNKNNKFQFKIVEKGAKNAVLCKLNVVNKVMQPAELTMENQYQSENVQLQLAAHKKFVDPTANSIGCFFVCLENQSSNTVFYSPLIAQNQSPGPANAGKPLMMKIVQPANIANWVWTKHPLNVNNRAFTPGTGDSIGDIEEMEEDGGGENSKKKHKNSTEEEEQEEDLVEDLSFPFLIPE